MRHGRPRSLAMLNAAAALLMCVPAWANDHGEPVPVAPTLEIEVLDPGADPLGNPAVELNGGDLYGRMAVEIPPVVLVHRYYYTGDRSFQAQLLPGGPSVLVFSHPETGERCYLRANLPPGAPRVIYNRNFIQYDYGSQAVTVTFKHHCDPILTYRQGVPARQLVGDGAGRVARASGRWLKRTGLPNYAHDAGRAAVGAAGAAADRINDVSTAVINPVVGLVKASPLGTALSSSAPQRALRQRDSLLRSAEARTSPNLDVTVPRLP